MVHTSKVRTEWADKDPVLTQYYDEEWGMPVVSETGVFERLCLESFQSGLSWLTILQRREGFRDAFHGFAPEAVAALSDHDVERLMGDTRIIRNRRKIEATVNNARRTLELRDEFSAGGLAELVWGYMPEQSPVFTEGRLAPASSPESEALAKELKQRGFSMVGPVTIYALMSAIGIVDLHIAASFRRGCSGLWHGDGSRTELAAPFQRS